MTTNLDARDARILELNTEGKTNEEIQRIIAREFPTLAVTARTIAARLPQMGGSARSAAVGDQKGDLTVEDILRQSAAFIAEHHALPPVPEKIQTTVVADMGFTTPQESVALFSDLHYYSKIDRRASNGLAEYNIDIARERLIRWRNGVLRFSQLNQIWVELDTMHILALGDDLEGHGEMFQSQSLQMSESIIFQVMGFVEDMVDILLSFLQRYKHIVIHKVPGNHGRVAARAKGAYTPDNFETLAWQLIAERVRNQTGGEWTTTENGNLLLQGGQIDFNITLGSIAVIDIMGWTCALRHGHGIKGLQATYTGAIANKLRLNSILGEIVNYYFKAHLHEAQSAEHEIHGEIIQNGCFVGPSLLSIEMSQAASNIPSQDFLLFHPTHGKTGHHRIHLATVDEVRQLEVYGRKPR
jgi:hypothetical protein